MQFASEIPLLLAVNYFPNWPLISGLKMQIVQKRFFFHISYSKKQFKIIFPIIFIFFSDIVIFLEKIRSNTSQAQSICTTSVNFFPNWPEKRLISSNNRQLVQFASEIPLLLAVNYFPNWPLILCLKMQIVQKLFFVFYVVFRKKIFTF